MTAIQPRNHKTLKGKAREVEPFGYLAILPRVSRTCESVLKVDTSRTGRVRDL